MEREREERRNSFLYTDVWDEHTRSEFLDATYEILDDCFWLWFLSWNHILFCKWSNSTHWGDKMEKTPLSLKCWHKYEKCCSCLMTSWSIVFNTLCVCMCVCVCVCSVMSDSLWPHGLWPIRLFCPWDFPGKNTGVGCHFQLCDCQQLSAVRPGYDPDMLSRNLKKCKGLV